MNVDGRPKVVEDLLKFVVGKVRDQENIVNLLNRNIVSGNISSTHMRIKVKEPKPYDGTRDAKLIGNLCWDMEQYLENMNGSLYKSKPKIYVMFLTIIVKL
jgi:hypothetical protein